MVIWMPSLVTTGAVGQATTHHDSKGDPISRDWSAPEGSEVEGGGVGVGFGFGGAGFGDAAAIRIRPD